MGTESISDAERRALASVPFDATLFDAIFCSPAQRCRETAEALGILDPVIDARLAEREFGLFEGLTAMECRESYPVEFELFCRLDAEFVIPDGESRAQHFTRIAAWLEDVSGYRNVLAVTHGGTIDFLYRLASGMPLHGGSQVYAGPNAARSTFEVTWPDVSVIEHGVRLF